MEQAVDIEKVKQYNSELKGYKEQASRLAVQIEMSEKELNRLCVELTNELGIAVNENNIEEIYNSEVNKLRSALDTGIAVLDKIKNDKGDNIKASRNPVESTGTQNGFNGQQNVGASQQTVGASQQTVGASQQTVGASQQTVGAGQQMINPLQQNVGNIQTVATPQSTVSNIQPTVNPVQASNGISPQVVPQVGQTVNQQVGQTVGQPQQTVSQKPASIGSSFLFGAGGPVFATPDSLQHLRDSAKDESVSMLDF